MKNDGWVEIPGYEGRYSVDFNGRICNMETGRMLTHTASGGEFRRMTVTLTHPETAIGTTTNVRRLVFQAFHRPIGRSDMITHKDGDFKNCRADNLKLYDPVHPVRHMSWEEIVDYVDRGHGEGKDFEAICKELRSTERRVLLALGKQYWLDLEKG